MFRLVTPPEPVLRILEGIVTKYNITLEEGTRGPSAYLEVISENGPVNLKHCEDFLSGDKWEFATASFNTDIAYFTGSEKNPWHGKAFLYGHGNICDAHCPREFISLDDLRACPDAYVRMVLELLGPPEQLGGV